MTPSIIPFRRTEHAHLVPALTKLLHESYAPLLAAGMNYLASRQDEAKTLERLEEGEGYLFFSGSELAGTVTLYEGVKKRVDYYQRPGVYLFGQFAIHPVFQGRGWGSRAMDFLEARAKELGARELALDTAETAEKLIRMYEARGYRTVSTHKWPEVIYRSLILSKIL
jgi:GNAT superfamily N-acetyltransferase